MSDAGTADERGIEEMPPVPAPWNVQRVVVALAWMVLGGVGAAVLYRHDVDPYFSLPGGVGVILLHAALAAGGPLMVAGFIGGIGLLRKARWSKWVLGLSAVWVGLRNLIDYMQGYGLGGETATSIVAGLCGYTVLVLIRVFPQASRRAPDLALDGRASPDAQRSPLPAHLHVHRIVVALGWMAVAGWLVLGLPAPSVLLRGAGQYMGAISGAGDPNAAAAAIYGMAMAGAFLFLVKIFSVVWVVGGIGLLYGWRWSKWVLGPSAVVMGLLNSSSVIILVFCGYTVWVLIKVFPRASRGALQPAAD